MNGVYKITFFLLVLILQGCTSLFFLPSSDRYLDPSHVGLVYNEEILNDGVGPKLLYWKLQPKGEKKGTILFLHGNAQNISGHLLSVAWLAVEGYEVYLFDLRGYGGSDGVPDIEGVHVDAARAVRFVQSQRPHDDSVFILFGQSLGAAIAITTAARDEFRNTFSLVIADSSFASYREIVREKIAEWWLLYPFAWPLSFLTRDDFSPVKFVDKIQAPLLLLHGSRDQTVPIHHEEALCAARGKQCVSWQFESEHISGLSQTLNREKLLNYIETITGRI